MVSRAAGSARTSPSGWSARPPRFAPGRTARPHNANLLGSHYRAIGIGVVEGVWAGHVAYYITADFGGS